MKEGGKKKREGDGFIGVEERGYWGGQNLILITLDRPECFSVFHHLQKDKQHKQRHSLKLGKKRRESSKRNYYIIYPTRPCRGERPWTSIGPAHCHFLQTPPEFASAVLPVSFASSSIRVCRAGYCSGQSLVGPKYGHVGAKKLSHCLHSQHRVGGGGQDRQFRGHLHDADDVAPTWTQDLLGTRWLARRLPQEKCTRRISAIIPVLCRRRAVCRDRTRLVVAASWAGWQSFKTLPRRTRYSQNCIAQYWWFLGRNLP